VNSDVTILIAESNDEDFSLIQTNLHRAGIWNEMLRFGDGQDVIDFLFVSGLGHRREHKRRYLLLLNSYMPKVDGFEILRRIKNDNELKKMPVIMLTGLDDSDKIESCHYLGCSICIVKPAENNGFTDLIQKTGLFLSIIKVPQINGVDFRAEIPK
jgi:CheY-like chemotaxis protein